MDVEFTAYIVHSSDTLQQYALAKYDIVQVMPEQKASIVTDGDASKGFKLEARER